MKKTILLLLLLSGCSIFGKATPDLESIPELAFLREELVFEYGVSLPLTLNEMAADQDYEGTIQDTDIDTSVLGTTIYPIVIEDPQGTFTANITVTVVDTHPADIVLKSDRIEIIQGTLLDVGANIESVQDAVDGALPLSENPGTEDRHYYTLAFDVDINTPGTYPVTVNAKDRNGNDSTSSFTVIVQERPLSAPLYINGILIANKSYALPEDFVPELTYFDSAYSVSSGYRGEPETVAQFQAMVDAMESEIGLRMLVTSSYRSYELQRTLYQRYVSNDGVAQADRYSARPGHSEHQTGLTVDVLAPGSSMEQFGSSTQYQWVKSNAHRFGFIIRYQEEKEAITGYRFEPWHLRYLGVEIATDVYNSTLSLEEYLGISSYYQ